MRVSAGRNNLNHLNEAYGFDITDALIAQVAKRIRARLRGKDHLGRYNYHRGVWLLHAMPAP